MKSTVFYLMLTWLKNSIRKERPLPAETPMTRERLIQRGRILFVDDDTPILIQELQAIGFSVDHDKTGEDVQKIDSQIYDVAIIDYHGVGRKLGSSQGLELVKHIERVSPRTRIIAYTSRSLKPSESDFYRLSNAVLPKDHGLRESFAMIEDQLQRAFSREHLTEALFNVLSIQDPRAKTRVMDALNKALQKGDESVLRDTILKVVGAGAEKAASIIVEHLFKAKTD